MENKENEIVTTEATEETEVPAKKTWKERLNKLKKPVAIAAGLIGAAAVYSKGKKVGYNQRLAEEADEDIEKEYDDSDVEEENVE